MGGRSKSQCVETHPAPAPSAELGHVELETSVRKAYRATLHVRLFTFS